MGVFIYLAHVAVFATMPSMAEQSYGTWGDWLLCLGAIILLEARFPFMPRNPEGHSPRWWKRHPEAVRPTAAPTSKKDGSEDKGIWRGAFGRWDVSVSVLFSIFLGLGLAVLGIGWFPHALLIAQVSFVIAGIVIIVAIIHHVYLAKAESGWSKFFFAVPLSAVTIAACGGAVMAVQAHKPKVSLSLRAFVALGHKKGDRFAGILWPADEIFDLRIVVDNIVQYPVKSADLTVSASDKDDVFWGMGQVTDFPGVDFTGPQMPDFPLKIRGKNGKIAELSPRDNVKLTYWGDHWNVFCPRLPRGQQLRLALAAIHAGDNEAPQRIKVSGNYEVVLNGSTVLVPVDQTLVVER